MSRTSVSKPSTSWLCRGPSLCFALTAAFAFYGPALGQSLADLPSSVVRIIVIGGGPPLGASGFLWQSTDQVVTSLHAVPNRPGGRILVECRGVRVQATVAKVLQAADLVLLNAPGLDGCPHFTSLQAQAPGYNSELHTYGFHNGASGTSRVMRKGRATDETLRGIIGRGPVLAAITEFGMPAPDRPIYYVQGGLLPGFSGAPVVDSTGRLVGIGAGGLNEGQSSVNWVIPAQDLNVLMASTDTVVPPAVAQITEHHWASGFVDPDQRTVREYVQGGWHYQWVRTKTQSLAELASTSDDPEGIRSLFQTYGSVVGADAEQRLRFDIYEDVDQGLIIAVPEGQSFEFDPQYDWLTTETDREGVGHIQYQQTTWGVTASDGVTELDADDPRYFDELISETLADCNDPGVTTCVLDEGSLRMVDFGNNNKILKVGFLLNNAGDSQPYAYDYYSFAVRGNVAFRAFGRLFPNNFADLFACAPRLGGSGCSGDNNALTHLALLVSVHLSTFAGLDNASGRRALETAFAYDPSFDDSTTLRAAYYEGGELRFYNSRGRIWLERRPGLQNQYREYRREDGYVYVEFGDDHAAIPVSGGEYHRSSDGGQTWVSAGLLQRR